MRRFAGAAPEPLRAMALLVLLTAAAPAGVVATEFVVLVLDHGLDHVATMQTWKKRRGDHAVRIQTSRMIYVGV